MNVVEWCMNVANVECCNYSAKDIMCIPRYDVTVYKNNLLLLTSTNLWWLMLLYSKCRKRLLWGSISRKRLNGSEWNQRHLKVHANHYKIHAGHIHVTSLHHDVLTSRSFSFILFFKRFGIFPNLLLLLLLRCYPFSSCTFSWPPILRA